MSPQIAERPGLPHERIAVEAPQFERVSRAVLAELANAILDGSVTFDNETKLMELTARQPYDATYGNIDVFEPGRWDTTYNLIYMDTIVTGSSAGQWTGSASYIEFKPPADGSYLIVGNFSGYQTTGHLYGPWGEATAYCAATSDSAAVIATYASSQPFQFNLNFTQNNQYGIGYIDSIQVFAL